MPVILWVICQR